MSPQAYKNRRNDTENSGIDLLRRMGIPFLYIVGALSAITGMICMGIITHQWSKISSPTCFLYAKSASNELGYTFGSSMSNCYWVAYGAIPSVVLLFICGVLYWFFVREKEEVQMVLAIVIGGMLIATALLLGVSCTLTEGMRLTCAVTGQTQVNNKADSCYKKLDERVTVHSSMPIKTSIMIRVTSGCLWTATCCSMFLLINHILSYNRRSARERRNHN